ncbi:T9SS-dependent choice-of-anchor J family protein [Nafulsella turpanensis]|uniref:T9SS-dependent choice-of-anchor J family protein n=1 Tax=Nafulsella turpanensis TaxID=1265690 RepID=UPI001268DD45|nr:choice-of-anchor J domain-containing protein [Nafulsella turpanensis]
MKNCCFRQFIFLAFFLCTPFFVLAQDKCGLETIMQLRQERHPRLPSEKEFEQWIVQKQLQRASLAGTNQRKAEIYELPVVVHVIHNGEAEGVGANIPDSQILRQIDILNEDFRKLNSEQISRLPTEFQVVAADTRIQFVLARQDPEGLPTDGIVRLRGSQVSYSMEDDLELKQLSHWSPRDYVNIYVAPLEATVIGYAQFPETDELDGLDLGKVSAQTDGVVIDYEYFGEGGNALPQSEGRTLTHEMGHFLGLRHIWGDGGCDQDDYVEDTPLAEEEHTGCPTEPVVSCGSPDMYQNYMDYTADRCMSLFTEGQAARMIVVLENSPRRVTLNDSRGKEEPTIVSNDAGLRQFLLLITDPCSKDFIPTVVVRNYGNNFVNSVRIGLYINGILYEQEDFNVNLDYLEADTLAMQPILLENRGELNIEAVILATNNTADNKEFNDQLLAELYAPERVSTPFVHDFETSLLPFYRINPDYNHTWDLTEAPITGSANNLAAYMNYYNYSINIGTRDLLVSPIFDLRNETQAFLAFQVAYAIYSSSSSDRLEVYVTTDCSESLENATLIYAKEGEELATAPATQRPFKPASNEDWRTEFLDLSAFAGEEEVQLIFVGVNDFGNNLFIDDIQVINELPFDHNLWLRSIRDPSVVSCENKPIPGILISNAGKETIKSLEVWYSVDGGAERFYQFDELNLAPLANLQLSLPILTLGEGKHTIAVRLASPNGVEDEIPENNFLVKNFVISQEREDFPLRQQFQQPTLIKSDWVSMSPNPAFDGWKIKKVPGPSPGDNFSAVSEFFDSQKGLQNWLVSPVLDLTEVEEAGVQFRFSYAPIFDASDILQVRVSTDCGQSWTNIVYEKKGIELSNRIVDARWTPRTASDWETNFIDLREFVGYPDVRVAFVAISDGGNDIFLDDIEFFQSNLPLTVDMPALNDITVFPNPTNDDLKVLFNLEENEEVLLQLYNLQGTLVYEKLIPNVLNQMYVLDLRNWHVGVYLLRVRSESINKTSRVLFYN